MGNEHDLELLVHKKLTGQISAEEKNILDLELQDAGKKKAADNMAAIWEQASELPAPSFNKDRAKAEFFRKVQTKSEPEIITLSPVNDRSTNGLRWLYWATAVASMFIVGYFAFFNTDASNLTTYASTTKSEKVSLPDGSSITLAPFSKLSFDPQSFANDRKVELSGTAHFEVAKIGKPFEVSTENYDVNVLGTTFTVQNQMVKVLEGKVKVSQHSRKNDVILTDRQGAKITNDKIEFIENVDFTDEHWIEPEMAYQNAPLSKVVSDIETKFRVKFEFRPNQQLNACNFTSGGSLKNINLDQIITILESALDATIEKKEGSVYSFKTLNCK